VFCSIVNDDPKDLSVWCHIVLYMARDNSIAISDQEREALREARQDIFGTDEVPYGVVIQTLVDEHYE